MRRGPGGTQLVPDKRVLWSARGSELRVQVLLRCRIAGTTYLAVEGRAESVTREEALRIAREQAAIFCVPADEIREDVRVWADASSAERPNPAG